MTNTTIPKALLDQIKEGKCVLFLGAGASFDAKHPDGENPPSGQQLSDLIALKFLGKEYLGSDLQYVSELAISETDLGTVQKFIADIFKKFTPGKHHLRLPLYNWHSIFTTNYDLIIESAYDKVPSRQQVLATFIKNGEKVQDKMSITNSVMYSKLHGSITDLNDIELPLILTADQYIDHRKNRDRLFDRLKEASYEYPILFVGFSFADHDIRYTLKELNNLGMARPRSYMIGPHITDAEARFWDSKKISSIKCSFAEFIKNLDDNITENERLLSTLVKEDFGHPITRKFQSDAQEPSDRLIEFLERDSEYVHKNLAAKDTDPKVFYKGYFENWDPIIKNFDVERKLTDSILLEIFLVEEEDRFTNEEFFLLKGNAGSGKTILMHRLAWEAAIAYDKLCIFYKSDISLEYNRISELYQLSKERIFLFVDGIADRVDEIEYILKKSKKDEIKLTLICSERTNVWNVEGDRLYPFVVREYELEYLNDSEIDGLLKLLQKHKSLGYLSGKPIDEQREALSHRSGRELLVALYEATAGKPFADIVMNEYKSIPSEEAKLLYLSICVFHRIGAYARAGIISRLHEISFSYFKEKLFDPLESVVYNHRNYVINDYVFTTRHQHIAELVFEQVLVDQESRYETYLKIISKLDVDYESDRQVFIALTNAKKLMDSFKDPEKIRDIYSVAYNNVGEQAPLLQQESIFEMNAHSGNLDKAESLLKKAHEIEPKNGFIAHSKAEFLLRKAEKSSQKLIIKNNLAMAREICKEIISNRRNKNISHGYHTLLKINIYELKKLLEEEDDNSLLIDDKIKEFEKILTKSTSLYPNESFLFDAEASFNNLVENIPKALASLTTAFEKNKRSPYLAKRLAKYHIDNENDLNSAIVVIKESLDLNVNNKDLNFQYAKLIMKLDPENYVEHKHYLRKSFTKHDKMYVAQFWYARTLYLLKDSENSEYFDFLRLAPIDNRIKKQISGIVTEGLEDVIFEGTIIKLENYFGFIKQDFNGERIYFARDKKHLHLRFNMRVKFKKGFTYNGPVALLEIENETDT
ncbi:SIR2-like domain-containing protein [Nonlabens sp. Hel1_33_55]|uniref:P-loop NTPase n=1 Tax=Nonlabens sp. Hel1_33_55 TaxID=1336802 RepID=UPI000875E21A|nr:SIR2 family protein [Nonlabens sp. Hel1_33_55]SCY04476.1 SIR2-like domain-containing protein [Nonlabens sp. Hel1_33_55]